MDDIDLFVQLILQHFLKRAGLVTLGIIIVMLVAGKKSVHDVLHFDRVLVAQVVQKWHETSAARFLQRLGVCQRLICLCFTFLLNYL